MRKKIITLIIVSIAVIIVGLAAFVGILKYKYPATFDYAMNDERNVSIELMQKEYERAADKNPLSRVCAGLIYSNMENGNYEEAITYIQFWLDNIDKEIYDVSYRVDLWRCYLYLGMEEEFKADYEKSEQEFSGRNELLVNMQLANFIRQWETDADKKKEWALWLKEQIKDKVYIANEEKGNGYDYIDQNLLNELYGEE